MVTIYVLDVPEFRAIIDCAQARGGCEITKFDQGYYRIQAASEIVLNRKEMKMKPAVWYGLFTGGLIGEIKDWGRDEVRVVGTNKPL
jgi:hypothetical protein